MKRRLFLSYLAAAPLVRAAPAAGDTRPTMRRALLVHGIWQSGGGCFRCLRQDLARRGVECLSPSLRPAHAQHGLEPLARQLKTAVEDRFDDDERFTLIAFSMGGLVSRLYLQELGGAARCDALVTISTPHHGTRAAYLHPGKGAREMRPESTLLKRLAKGEDRLGEMPLVSYRTPRDAIILPSESSIWERAENLAIDCPLHPMMPGSLELRRDLLARFRYPGP